MTVILDRNPSEVFKLVQGQTYSRPRGENSLKADSSNFNINSKWPEDINKFGKLWAIKVKGDEYGFKVNPSIKEVVLGIFQHYIEKLEISFKELIESDPVRFKHYGNYVRKAFNHLLFSLDIPENEFDQPMTKIIYENPYSP